MSCDASPAFDNVLSQKFPEKYVASNLLVETPTVVGNSKASAWAQRDTYVQDVNAGGKPWWSMLQPLCSWWSIDTEITCAGTG